MSGADTGADVVRRLVLLERIPMLAELSPAVLYGLAERASGALVRQGDPLGGGPEITLVPLGAQVTHAPHALDAHALGLLEGLAGRPASGATESLADTAVVRVRLGDLHAVLEDEFSLFLAVASAVAGALIDAARAVNGARFGDPALLVPGGASLELIERVVCLRSTLPFARDRVASLVQLARLASEVRTDDGIELFRQGEASDVVMLPIQGSLRARVDGRDAFTLAAGSVLPMIDVVSRQPRWFSASTVGAFRALVIPIERFLDVLEDQPELARATLRSLAEECLRVRLLEPLAPSSKR